MTPEGQTPGTAKQEGCSVYGSGNPVLGGRGDDSGRPLATEPQGGVIFLSTGYQILKGGSAPPGLADFVREQRSGQGRPGEYRPGTDRGRLRGYTAQAYALCHRAILSTKARKLSGSSLSRFNAVVR